jgi:glutamate--cysteine ligase
MTESQTIGTRKDLLRFFDVAFKPPHAWQVGIEFEKLGVNPQTGVAVSYSGDHGVEAVLKRLGERYGWEPLTEGNHLLGLKRGGSRITLEPGAQLELSEEPHRTLHELADRIRNHIEELHGATDPLRTAWIGLGCHPVSEWQDIELIPKARYHIMDRYNPGKLWRSMMRETAAIQINMDYENELDAMEKFRLAMAISPLLTALYANSCISGGRLNGFLTRRAYIWQHTDPDRCGFIKRLYQLDAGFQDYVDYALDVPLVFIVRDGRWVEVLGAVTFRRFLEEGFDGHRATWDDWVLHLSTLFTEARFKPYLEIRGADCPLPGLFMSFPALLKGIVYDREARKAVWELLGDWSEFERQVLYLKISREGPATRVHGRPIREHILDFVQLSRQGLKRQARRNGRGEDETVFLEPLEARLRDGRDCPAGEIRTLWKGPWEGDIAKLVEFSRF